MGSIQNVGSAPGVDPSTGLPIVETVAAKSSKIVYSVKTKGTIQFLMIGVNNKNARIILYADGDTKIDATPLRLYYLGVTSYNGYLWVDKFDETNDVYSILMSRPFKFKDHFRLVIESPSDASAGILDYNIFWEEER